MFNENYPKMDITEGDLPTGSAIYPDPTKKDKERISELERMHNKLNKEVQELKEIVKILSGV